ncbi:MAG: ATP-binding protein [Bacteroidota bacterium]
MAPLPVAQPEHDPRPDALAGDRIWAGGHDEIGYFAPDARGQLTFTSYVHLLPDSARQFYDVNRIAIHDTGVYVLTDEHLMRWHAETMTILAADGGFQDLYHVDGALYVESTGHGLRQLVDDALVPLDAFPNALRVSAMLPLGDGRTLVASTEQGLFHYVDGALTPFRTDADARLRADDAFLLEATRVGDMVVLMLAYDEVLILNQDGEWLRTYRVGETLSMPLITMTSDPHGRLWLALDDGFMQVDLLSPATNFGSAEGVSYTVFEVARHNGELFAASPDVLLQLQPATRTRPARFAPAPGVAQGAYTLISTSFGILLGGEAIWHMHEGQLTEVSEQGATTFIPARDDSTVVFAGMIDGLATLRYRDGRWTMLPDVAPWDGEAGALYQDASGAVWAGLFYGGIRRITWPKGYDEPPQLEVFREAEGVPYGESFPSLIDGELGFGSWEGVFRYDPTQDPPFSPDTSLAYVLPPGYSTLALAQLQALHPDTVWIQLEGRLSVQQRAPDGRFRWRALESTALTYPTRMHLETPSVGWIGGTGGLVRYDAKLARGAAALHPPLLSHIRATHSDSVLYGGFGALPNVTLPYTENDVRLELAAPLLTVPDRAQYQVWLEGYDEDWSAWGAEATKEYTNLPEGDYVFHARVRDGNLQSTAAQTWAFRIQPPWYRTGWAWLAYLLAGAAGVLGLVQWRTDHLHRRAARLEAEVEARTAQVEAQNAALETQNTTLATQTAQIAEQADQLRRLDAQKSRFFAHISHEFKTPLTLIQGPVERALAGDYGPLSALMKDHLGITQRSIGQLKGLIDELLELSRLDAEGLQLQRAPVDLRALVRQAAASFASLAASRMLDVTVDTADDALPVYADAGKLERVLNNLLSNAIKFTEAGGRITLRAMPSTAEMVQVEVIDTGLGIPAEDLPHLFDLFYQASNGSQQYAGGTGIGLALAKEIATAHGGSLTVTSTLGEGTCFTLALPAGHGLDVQGDGAIAPEVPHMAPVQVAASVAAIPPTAPPKATVLVVEDHADLRAYLADSLAPHYHVLTAADGQEALALAHTSPPDLVLTDLMMPQMDGLKLLEALRDDEVLCATPVILLTARDAAQDRIDAWSLRADAYMAKPFTLTALRARIDGLLALRQQLRRRYGSTTLIAAGR